MAGQDNFGLSSQDLIRFESILKGYISRVVTFESHSLYFPQKQKPDSRILQAVENKEAVFLPREKQFKTA
ncbi:MAG: hypothetical protein ACOC0U_03605 [Desulfovibrionales bacterium]